MVSPRFFFIFGLVLTGVLSRLLPHPPNFTSMNAIALFGAFYFGNQWLSFFVVSLTMILSDLVLGYHPCMSFVYLSFGLIGFLGNSLKKNSSSLNISKISILSSFLFFAVTNFGDWVMLTTYPKTIEGLALCYAAGVPFISYQILGDLTFSLLFFKLYAMMTSRLENGVKLSRYE